MKSHLIFCLPFLLLFSCSGEKSKTDEAPIVWFKGNTHAHTVICGHADTPPDSVALWYLERDYNFLILSEHNHFIDPDSVSLPTGRRTDFILVPGEEVTGRQAIHTTGMNVRHYVEGQPNYPYLNAKSTEQAAGSTDPGRPETKTDVIQQHTDSIIEAGGLAILNHPNFVSGAQPQDILPVKRLHLFELYNGHPAVYNWGNEAHIPVEAKWDSLLTAGMLILGVSSDDAHQFQSWTEDTSNPGRGWVMVDSKGVLTADAITEAMARGHFYATNGVILSNIEHSPDHYTIEIDTSQSRQTLRSPYIIGKKEVGGSEGYQVEFIGEHGDVLYTTSDLKAHFPIEYDGSYVRGKVTFTRKTPDGKWESFFAWTQPRFLDERAQMLEANKVWTPPHDDHDHPHDH